MSISMNNHETRIKALENKIGSGGGIVESNMSNPGYVKFANGLIMNFGIDNIGVANKTVNFYKSYPNKCLAVVCSPNRHDGYVSGSDCSILNNGESTRVPKITNTGFSILNSWSTGCNYFAIGYLITNRLLTYLREVI